MMEPNKESIIRVKLCAYGSNCYYNISKKLKKEKIINVLLQIKCL